MNHDTVFNNFTIDIQTLQHALICLFKVHGCVDLCSDIVLIKVEH